MRAALGLGVRERNVGDVRDRVDLGARRPATARFEKLS